MLPPEGWRLEAELYSPAWVAASFIGDPSAFIYGALRSMMIAYVPD
jgi:hypothetical protein